MSDVTHRPWPVHSREILPRYLLHDCVAPSAGFEDVNRKISERWKTELYDRSPSLKPYWCNKCAYSLPISAYSCRYNTVTYRGTNRTIQSIANHLPRVMKGYSPTGRKNHGRHLKRLSGYVRPERVNKWPNSMTDI
jgi:hypothetical protein